MSSEVQAQVEEIARELAGWHCGCKVLAGPEPGGRAAPVIDDPRQALVIHVDDGH